MRLRIFCIMIFLFTTSCNRSTDIVEENEYLHTVTPSTADIPTDATVVEGTVDRTVTVSPSPLPNASSIIFPQSQTQSSAGEALLIGEVVVVDSCLRVDARESSTDYIPIWPNGFSLRDENGIVEVLNEQGQVVARVGEEIQAGGGGIPRDSDMSWILPLAKPLPELCPGQYWAIGQVDPLE